MLRKYIALLLFLLSMISCQEKSNQSELKTPVNPSVQIEIIRMDQLIEDQPIAELSDRYPAFVEVYLRQIMALPPDTAVINQEISRMLSDTSYHRLARDVQREFPSLERLEPRIAQTIENYMTLFDIDKVPKVYTFLSGFVYQTFLFEDVDRDGVGVGLDMFLGEDFPYRAIDPNNARFSEYLTRTYDDVHIPRKIAQVLVEDQLPPPTKNDFLSLMMYGGKRLYLIDQILSFEPDSIVAEYTAEQLQWCRENEAEMWEYFFDRNLFYETDLRKFGKLVAPAPSSPGMPPESPGATANYMGWRIVQAYMRRHPSTTIRELIDLDPQKLLDGSKYKPNRRS